MHNMRLSNGVELSGNGISRFMTIARSTSILALVINVKIAETATSFSTGWNKYWYNDHFYYSCNT